VICIVLEGDPAEEEGDDARHLEAVTEKVTDVGSEGHKTGFDVGIQV